MPQERQTHIPNMEKKSKKPSKRKTTTRQRLALMYMAKHGDMSQAEAMRRAGYSKASARNPQYLTKKPLYTEILNENGLDDQALSNVHRQLMKATVIEKEVFPGIKTKSKQAIEAYVQQIKRNVESNEGCELLSITQNWTGEFVAVFKKPETGSRLTSLSMAYKVKGHFAPIKVDAPLGGYNIDPKDKEKLDTIFDGI